MFALIIDDSRAQRRMIRRIVESLGFEIIEAENGQEGLDQLNAHPDASLVLVDWNMPVMNGIDFVVAAREQAEFKSTPIVMVTTETEPARMARAIMSGVDEFVMKPFTPDVLIEKLQLLGVKFPATTEA